MAIQHKSYFDFWGLLEDKTTKIVKAIADNDPDKLSKLLDKTKPEYLNQKSFGPGWSFLHYASILGHDDCVQLLIDKHAKVNMLTSFSESPLFMAIRHKHSSTVSVLLGLGANPEICAKQVEVNGLYYDSLSPKSLAKLLGLGQIGRLLDTFESCKPAGAFQQQDSDEIRDLAQTHPRPAMV